MTVCTLKNTLNLSTTIYFDYWYGFNTDQLEYISFKHFTVNHIYIYCSLVNFSNYFWCDL